MLGHLGFTLTPTSFFSEIACLNRAANPSEQMANNSGDNGSPCRSPLVERKYHAGTPFIITEKDAALPIYVMSCFLLPVTLCRKLDKHMARFWWGYSVDKEKAHWVSWRNLCRSKFDGGLGFRRFEDFNQALLAKVAWRVWQEPHTLLAQVLKGKYFAQTSILQAKRGSRPSWGWTSVLHGRDLLQQGLVWQIGDGKDARVLEDRWIPGVRREEVCILPSAPVLTEARVESFLVPGSGKWCVECLQQCFPESVMQRICSIPLPVRQIPDRCVWAWESDGEYTVKSGYHLALQISRAAPGWKEEVSFFDMGFWKKVWGFPLPPKLKFFVWQLLRRVLPTAEAIFEKRGQNPTEVRDPPEDGETLSPRCPVCWEPVETLEHLFLSCRVAVDLWNRSGVTGVDGMAGVSNFALFFRSMVEQDDGTERIVRMVALLWRIWKSRNWVVFEHIQYDLTCLVRQFEMQVREWMAFVQPEQVPVLQRRISSGGRGPVQLHLALPFSCYVDGAVAPGSHGAGGLVIRDGMGRVCMVKGFYYAGIVDPFLVELVAFRDAVQWCLGKGMDAVWFYGDAKGVIEKIQRRDARDMKGGAYLWKLRSCGGSIGLLVSLLLAGMTIGWLMR
ncbi:unnamed protein product [Linum trigynum]|uniref:RNase H type-1 domain-containing protein n=1 Tax=Linum trigynum TaxID=586398 RepID=A0AAV2ECG0_9ROSI